MIRHLCKSLIFKYGRMQKKISSQLVSGSHGTSLECMLPGVELTAGLGIFLCSSHLCDRENCDSLAALTGLAFLSDP